MQAQTISVSDKEGLFPTRAGGRVLGEALLHLLIIPRSAVKSRCSVLMAEKGSKSRPVTTM